MWLVIMWLTKTNDYCLPAKFAKPPRGVIRCHVFLIIQVDNCGFGVAQRPEDYHTQHRQLKLKMTKMRGDIDYERSDAPMCRVRIATLWSGGHVNLTAVRIFMQLGNGSSIFGWTRFASCAPVQHFGRVRLASQLKRWAKGHIMCCSRMDD